MNNRPGIVMHCFDQLSVADCLALPREHRALAQSVIEALAEYPTPTGKPDRIEAGAYLYVCSAGNVLRLAMLGFVPFDQAFVDAYTCFEIALGLLTDKD